MQQLLGIALLSTLLSCSAVRVSYDYDKQIDFSHYTTYQYLPNMQSGLNQLDENRIRRALNATLHAKGYRLATSADLFIDLQSRDHRNPSNNAVGIGMGGTGRNVGGGISVGVPLGTATLHRQIQFSVIDASKDALVWQALTTTPYPENASPQRREKTLTAVVHKALAKFPPSKP